MKFSIIIPTIGRPILKEVIASLLPQISEYPNTNIYISYDGLKDSSDFQKIKSNYIHKRIHILSTEFERSGASNARNIALQKALPKSYLIAFLGDDTIPSEDWVQKTIEWHTSNPNETQAVLGRVYWTKNLIKDPFHKWLDGNIQFDYKNLGKGRQPDWRHFTTSNLSLKSKALHKHVFNTHFTGWGFEDGELGYRLEKHFNLNISYDPNLKVYHDHPQTFSKVLQNLKNARKNAQYFELIHPKAKVLPQGFKKILLTILAFLSFLIPKALSKELYWWSRCKLVWLGYLFPIQND